MGFTKKGARDTAHSARKVKEPRKYWMPACAGMTERYMARGKTQGLPCPLSLAPCTIFQDRCSMRMFKMRRIGSAAPHRSWSPQVKAVR